MELTRGKPSDPQRIVLHGPPAIGKTSLASKMPDPVFVDLEDSTSDIDVVRAPIPGSWRALVDMTEEFARDHHGRQSLVIDTADAAEKLCIGHICATHNLQALGGNNDFGHSYSLLETEWCRWLDSLTRVMKSGMHVCLCAHSRRRKNDEVDQPGWYDRWEMDLELKTAAAIKQWARTILFLDYKVYVVQGERKGQKSKATGGQRVIKTTHHPCWDAKNRAGLLEELPLEYGAIAHLFERGPVQTPTVQPQEPPPGVPEPKPAEVVPPAPAPDPVPAQTPAAQPAAHLAPLFELMKRDGVSEREVQLAVAKRGYYPADTPLGNFDPQFVAGKLVAFWPQVKILIDQVRQEAAAV